MTKHGPNPDDLTAVATAPLMTGRYQKWRTTDGVPLGITVGRPRFWRHPERPVVVKVLAPYGLLDPAMSDDEARRLYLGRLDDRADEIIPTLADIARRHPGRPLVALCYEDVHAGQVCHRRWLADWMADRFGIVVDEVSPPPTLF